MKNLRRGVSFVIPARNEEHEIAITISSIKEYAVGFDFEIIVVNHNSVDSTASVASSMGAVVYNKYDGTIGSARNFGVQQASFDVIIFVDADVSLTEEWMSGIELVLDKTRKQGAYVTGSHCVPPADGSYLERYWFSNFSQEVKTTHLGTGHMIMSKLFFDRIGGFSEALQTGEDYDICQKAKANGALVENNPNLLVVHRDYPKNIIDFFRRERWHGRGDAQSFKHFLSSRVSMASSLHVIFHLLLIVVIVMKFDLLIILFSILLLLLIPFLASLYKFKSKGFHILMVNTFIFYVYFWARFLSIFS